MSIAELRAKQATLVAEARAELDKITPETDEARQAEVNAAHDKAMAEYDKLEERIKREEKLAEREADLNAADERRPRGEDRAAKGGKKDERTEEQRYADAFNSFVRRGRVALNADERALLAGTEGRAQQVGVQSLGGYLVPGQFQAELIKGLKAWGPMLDPGVTRMIETGSGATITWPAMDDTANEGALIAEGQTVSTTDVYFGTRSLDAYKYTSGVVLISDELLQDAVLDPELIVRAAMEERIGRIGNKHLTIGDGANKPRGIVTAAGSQAAAGAAVIAFDDLINLEHSVDPAYRSDPSSKFMFNDATLKALRKLKDLEGNYIWQPANVQTGAPARILNYGYEINQAMADIATTNRSVVFGAFNRYIVRIVKEFAMKRLVERYADSGQVGFIGFTRLDGDLMDTNAVKALVHP